jgi:branched-chain amino acid transport system substrate-binding protein
VGTLGALLVGATACLSGGSSSSSSGGGPLHFAVLASYTGNFSDVGQAMWEGAKAGAAAVNASGGIMGRKLVVDLVDTVGDPADAVPALNKELVANKPVGAIGPTTSEIFGLQPILDRNHLPYMFEGGCTCFDNNKDKYLWRNNPSDSQLGVAMAAWALKQGYKSGAVTFSTEQSAQTLKGIVKDSFTKNGGKIVAEVNLTPAQSSYRSEILQVVNAHPDVVFVQTEPTSAGAYLSDFKQLDNLSIPFVGSDLTAGSDFIKAITPAVAHDHFVSAVGSSAPGGGADAFNKFYAQTWHHQPLASANYAYDGVVDLALAMDKAGSTDPSQILSAIPAVSNPPGTQVVSYATGLADINAGKKIKYQGASGPMTFNQFHNVFGPFDIVQSDPSGNLTTLITFNAEQLQRVTTGKGLP